MGFSSWAHLDVERVVKDTGKAFLVILDDGSEQWIPRSVVSEPDLYEEGDEDITISVVESWAEKEGLA